MKISTAAILPVILFCSCLYISDTEIPQTVEAYSEFEVLLEVTSSKTWGGVTGGISAMLPDTWVADGVTYSGPCSGSMEPYQSLSENLAIEFPPPTNCHWCSFASESGLSADSGDVFSVSMTVHTDSILGEVPVWFHVAVFDMYWGWDQDPVICSVVVYPLDLQSDTWAGIKTSCQ